MDTVKIHPKKKYVLSNKGECLCCLNEERTLYTCGISKCSWHICEDCYKKTYHMNNDKCPACRNSIQYKIFTPNVYKLPEVRIEILPETTNRSRANRILTRYLDKQSEIFMKCLTAICEAGRTCVTIFAFIVSICLAIFIGRYVIWVISPCFLGGLDNCRFWISVGWFVVAGICGILFMISCFCVCMCVYTCHDNDDMFYD